MKIGVFHPAIDMLGGAEFVVVVIVNTLARNGYEVELFTNKKIDQKKTEMVLGERISSTVRIVVKPTFMHPRGMLDLYQNIFKTLLFKSKCDVLLDTYSNCVFPWTNISYIHFPYLNRYFFRPEFPYLRSPHIAQVSGLPYVVFEKHLQKYHRKLLIANSFYTAEAIKEFTGIKAEVLYPPIPSALLSKSSNDLNSNTRKDLVVAVSRFGVGKGLEKIPYIAKFTDSNINFAIIGLVHDEKVLSTVLRSIEKLNLANRVKVLTNVSRHEMKTILNTAKTYLHTMVGEHFGISIAEAMAMGCIPIVHDSGGVKEFVPSQYRYKDLRGAAIKVETAVLEWTPEKAKAMVEIAKQFSESNFSKNFTKLFSEYLNNTKAFLFDCKKKYVFD